MKNLTVFALLFFCSLLFSPVVWSQDFSSVDSDLQALENLNGRRGNPASIINFPYHRQTSQFTVRFGLNDTIANTEEQQKLLEDLRANLNKSGNLIADYENIIQEQEKLLANLQLRLNEMSETYRTQSLLSATAALKPLFVNEKNIGPTPWKIYSRDALNVSRAFSWRARSSKFWRTFTIVAIPVTAVISGTVVWAAGR